MALTDHHSAMIYSVRMTVGDTVKIKQAMNGFIVTTDNSIEHVFLTLDEVFDYLLLHYEGRGSTFTGDLYGKVRIERTPVSDERCTHEDKAIVAAARRYVKTYETTGDGDERMAAGDALWSAVDYKQYRKHSPAG